jgi:nucleotide-binding universal stress UspA family protein
MIKFKILGVGTSEHEYLKNMLVQWMEEENSPFEIEDVNNIERFIESGITSIPAVIINDYFRLQRRDFQDLKSFAKAIQEYVEKINSLCMKKILVPTDFSETSNNALTYALKMASFFDSEIELLHVFHPAVDINNGYFLDPELETKKREKLSALAGDIGQNNVALANKIKSKFILGFPIEEIISLSKHKDALIIMGATGSSGIFGQMFGSISSEVARNAHCPVMLIPDKVHFEPYTHIMYATNEPEFDAKMASLIKGFVSTFDAALHCIHVDRGSDYYPDWEMQGIFGSNGSGVKLVEGNISNQNVSKGLNEYAENNQIDLMILSTKHRNFWKSLVHKSVTRTLSLKPHLPLLVFHAEDKLEI